MLCVVWLQAPSAPPTGPITDWSALQCSSDLKAFLQASSVPLAVAKKLVDDLGVTGKDDLQFVTPDNLKAIALKPVEEAKLLSVLKGQVSSGTQQPSATGRGFNSALAGSRNTRGSASRMPATRMPAQPQAGPAQVDKGVKAKLRELFDDKQVRCPKQAGQQATSVQGAYERSAHYDISISRTRTDAERVRATMQALLRKGLAGGAFFLREIGPLLPPPGEEG